MNDPRIWWFVSRSSGLIAWAALSTTVMLGLLLTSRILKPSVRPPWLLTMHRHLAMLYIATIGLHLGSLVFDSYVEFGPRELLVPMASTWRPTSVTFGILAFYYTVLVQVTSLMMRRMSRNAWRGIHLASYVSFALATVHGFAAGTDVLSLYVLVPGVSLLAAVALLLGIRMLLARGDAGKAEGRRSVTEGRRATSVVPGSDR